MTQLLGCRDLQIDLVDDAGQTAVHKAAAGGRSTHLQKLVECGASLSIKDASGSTPLHLAAAHVLPRACVKILVDAGADRDVVDAGGASPLHHAPAAMLSGCSWFPGVLPLLATPSNINLVVKGTTLLHTSVAGELQGVVSALLAAGANPTSLDGGGESALTQAARQGTTAMLSLLLRHLLRQHLQQGGAEAVELPREVALAMQEAVARSTAHGCCVWTAVMDVAGEGTASALWQQLIQQPPSSVAGPAHLQSGSQQQQGLQQQQQPQSHQGPGRAQQPQKQPQLKRAVMEVLLKGWKEACATWAQQRKSSLQPLAEAIKDSSSLSAAASTGGPAGVSQPAASSQEAAVPAGAPQPAAVGAGAASGSPTGPCMAQPAAKRSKATTIGQLAAAAGLGQQAQVQELLQQLPAGMHASALAKSAKAATAAGHYHLCMQLAQQLAAQDSAKALLLVQGVVAQGEGRCYDQVEVLRPSSLALCGALLGGWVAVRRQQQQELVDGVVSAAVAWKQAQLEGCKKLRGEAQRQHVAAPSLVSQLPPQQLAATAGAGDCGAGVQPAAVEVGDALQPS
jgi:hypothetical protein